MVYDDLKVLFKNNTLESRTIVKERFKELTKSYHDKAKLGIVFSLKYFEEQE